MNRLHVGILLVVSTLLLVSAKFQPVLGMQALDSGEDQKEQATLDGAMYTFHTGEQAGELLAEGTCTDCHTGYQFTDQVSMFSAMGVACLDCHAGMASMVAPLSMHGVLSITCPACHDHDNDPAVTDCVGKPVTSLYANDIKSFLKAGGDGTSIDFCNINSNQSASSNMAVGSKVQLVQPFGYISAIIKCSACHTDALQESFGHFGT